MAGTDATQCTRCGKYTLFPPLCAECEREQQQTKERAERPPAVEESPDPARLLDVAAKELGMSVEALNRQIKKGNATYSYETKVTVTRVDGSDPVFEALKRDRNYDALLRIAHRRDTNASRLRTVFKALVIFAVLYWLLKPLAGWLQR